MKATIYISGVIGEETSLTDVIRQFKSYEEPTEVEVNIHSEGGNVDEGESIYNYLRNLDLPVTTITDKAYSIAAQIFMSGDTRIVEDVDKAVMIHFAWAEVQGKAEKLEAVAKELRKIENEFASFYSGLLGIDKDTVKALLDNETFISGSEAVELGFATELKSATKAVAKYESKNLNLKQNKMSKAKTRLLNAFKALLENDEPEVNALVLQDSNGTEIDFADVAEGENPQVGDAGTIDGEPVPDGEYIMPSLEDATVVFVDGKISEIKPADDGSSTEDTTDTTDVNAEIIKEVMNWEVETISTSFNEGDTLEYEYDGETYSFGVGEYFIPSIGKSVVTDANGVIVKVKEVSAPAETTDANAQEDTEVEAELEKVIGNIEAKVSAKFEKKFKAQEEKIKALNKLVGSKEFKAENTDTEGNQSEKKSGNYLTGVLRNVKRK